MKDLPKQICACSAEIVEGSGRRFKSYDANSFPLRRDVVDASENRRQFAGDEYLLMKVFRQLIYEIRKKMSRETHV